MNMDRLKSVLREHEDWKCLETTYVQKIEECMKNGEYVPTVDLVKSLLESVGKEICNKNHVRLSKNPKVQDVIKGALTSIILKHGDSSGDLAKRLTSVTQCIIEIRNNFGIFSHGRIPEEIKEIEKVISRHDAELLVGASESVAVFLIRYFEEQKENRGKTNGPSRKNNFKVPENLKPDHASALATASLIGKWDENNQSDIEIINTLTDDYDNWVTTLRRNLLEQNSCVSFSNGVWKVKSRRIVWNAVAGRIFDENLDAFRECAFTVLTEINSQFDLLPSERYAASLHGKKLQYSNELRKGLTETLALLGSINNKPIHCSQDKAESIALLSIREIFNQADWKLWSSLDRLLPILAEASPREFLDAVANALQVSPCPFDEIFAQERHGVFGSTYMSGLLWGFENLAWDEEHLTRVAVLLAELATHDPGGQWMNRPINSLTTILLPWFPQTLAPLEKRRACIDAIKMDFPEIAWRVAVNLLPSKKTHTSGTHKPRWRNPISEDWNPKVTNKEYGQEVESYAKVVIYLAQQDINKLVDLIKNIEHFHGDSFDKALQYLGTDEIQNLPEKERSPIWDELTGIANKHRRYSEAQWALDEEQVSQIEQVADNLKPQSHEGLAKRIFDHGYCALYEYNGDWKSQRDTMQEKRREAVNTILKEKGTEGVINFSKNVKDAHEVGLVLGWVGANQTDLDLLPKLLNTKDECYEKLISGFIWERFHRPDFGWDWVDGINKDSWQKGQILDFLICLPFKKETWQRAEIWLGNAASNYWGKVQVRPYGESGEDLQFAIDKLTGVGHTYWAIHCFDCMVDSKIPLDTDKVIQTLITAASEKQSCNNLDTYQVTKLITILQKSPGVPESGLHEVESAYLPLLTEIYGGQPITLWTSLANNPGGFCEIIQLLYRSKNTTIVQREHTDREKSLANNAYCLLSEWKIPPGQQKDGRFSSEQLLQWLNVVKEECKKLGHLTIAMIHVGEVLFHAPADDSGLWINKDVAKVLNETTAKNMRRGYSTRAFNSRGVRVVGDSEQVFIQQWEEKINDIENAGFARFASELRNLVKSFRKHEERMTTRILLERDDYD